MAKRLAKLLRSAFPVAEIRCTSVDGFRLPGGADTDDQLRAEIITADAFIGLFSPESLTSTYVLLEIGARWGTSRHLVPVMAPGCDASALKGPIAGKNALDGGNRSQMHQLLDELAVTLNMTKASAARYEDDFEEFVSAAPTAASLEPTSATPIPQPAPSHTSPPPKLQFNLKPLNDALVVELINFSGETIRNLPINVTDILRKRRKNYYVESEPFHRELSFPTYSIATVTLFPGHEHRAVFADGSNPGYLNFPGTRIGTREPVDLKVQRKGEWMVTFDLAPIYHSDFHVTKCFSWAPGSPPQVVACDQGG